MDCSSFGASTGAGSRTGSVYLRHDTRLKVFVYIQLEAEERGRSAGTGRRRAGLSAGTGVLST